MKLNSLEPEPAMTPAEDIFRVTFPQRIPGYEIREQQIQMARLIEDALANREHLIAEAGTGTGKSYAYLVPLALWLKESHGRAVVSTGTIALQEQLLAKDIPALEKVLDFDLDARLAKGKGNYLCLLRLEEEMRNWSLFSEEDVLRQISDWAKDTETGDKSELPFEAGEIWGRVCADDSCLGHKCHYDRCFYLKAKTRLQAAQIIVCNHALFFTDLNLKESTGGYVSLLPEYQVVVFDEAHHIEKTAREALSTQISNMRLPVLLGQLRKREGCSLDAVQVAHAANEAFFGVLSGTGDADRFLFPRRKDLTELGGKLINAVCDTFLKFDKTCIGEREESLFKCLKNYIRDLEEFFDPDPGQEKVYWVEKGRANNRLRVVMHATPVDVSDLLSFSVFKNEEIRSVVMTSATLSTSGNFDYFKKSVGCRQARELSVESPFDYSSQCLIYIPHGLPDPKAADFYEQVTPFIENILLKTDGRAFVLFTSYKGMNEVYDRLAGRLKWTVFRQGDMPKQKLLEAFREDVYSVLFATASFWEGVDVQGEALSCVILVKLPFAVPDDPVTEARIKAIERTGGNAFAHYTLPEAIIRLKQGFGRLIRTKADRGIVAILDPRVKTKGYGRKFLNSLPRCREISSLENVDLFLKRDEEQRKPVIQANWGSGKSFTAMIVLPGLGIENFKKDA